MENQYRILISNSGQNSNGGKLRKLFQTGWTALLRRPVENTDWLQGILRCPLTKLFHPAGHSHETSILHVTEPEV
jgi:hypothetical protein